MPRTNKGLRPAKIGTGILLIWCGGCALPKVPRPGSAREMAVQVYVANVRAKPIPHQGRYEFDPLQETQVSLGEHVLVTEQAGGWAHVLCPEQMAFRPHGKWE